MILMRTSVMMEDIAALMLTFVRLEDLNAALTGHGIKTCIPH